MKSLLLVPLLSIAAATLSVMLDLPFAIRALTVIPALLVAPGWGWSRRLGASNSWLQTGVYAVWISIAIAVVNVSLVRLLGGGSITMFITMFSAVTAWTIGGSLWAVKKPLVPLAPLSESKGAYIGTIALFALVGALAITSNINQPLERWWYNAEAMGEWEMGPTVTLPDASTETGWISSEYIGSYENSNTPLSLTCSDNSGGRVEIKDFDQGKGVVWIAATGDIGMELSVTSYFEGVAQSTATDTVEADVIEEENEGLVPRYLSRGAAGVPVRFPADEISIHVQGAGSDSKVFVMPGTDGIWGADHLGELHFVHYYQILNIVENQRWAAELYEERILTINQPPLWSYVLAIPTLLIDSDLPGANALLLFIVLLVGLTSLSVVETVAPAAPTTAWLIPATYAAVHFKLMLDPGSTNFPDSLYAAALLAGVGALFRASKSETERWWVVCFAIAAGALRYPGVIITTLAGVLMWLLARRSAWRSLKLLWLSVVVLGVLVFGGAWFIGQLDHLAFTLWFETGPEHYHGDYSLLSMLHRAPEFFYKWISYLGFGSFWIFGLIFSFGGAIWLLAANRTSRWIISTALCYGALLSTIDHSPTHYFLPLIGLTGLSIVSACSTLRGEFTRQLVPAVFVAAGLLFLVTGQV